MSKGKERQLKYSAAKFQKSNIHSLLFLMIANLSIANLLMNIFQFSHDFQQKCGYHILGDVRLASAFSISIFFDISNEAHPLW